jgi:hypothetical protein
MNKTEMNRQVFEIMLKAAVEEDFEQELQEISKAEELSDHCELSRPAKIGIEKMIRKAYRHSVQLRVEKAAKRAALVFAIILPVSLGSLLSVEASRNAIFNALMDWKSDHVDIHYQEKNVSSKTASSGYSVLKPNYLPEGYYEAKTVRIGPKTETEYENAQKTRIILDQVPLSEEGSIAVDTEHTKPREIEIHGEKASLFAADSKGKNSYMVWKSHSFSFLLVSKIEPEELLKIAESIDE